MQIVAHELSERMDEKLSFRIDSVDDEANLKYCSLWQDADRAREDTIYLVNGNQRLDRSAAKGKRLSLVFVEQPASDIGKNCDFIVLPAPWSLSDAFNAVQEIFIKYREWEFSLQEAVSDGASISELTKISLPLFNNTILVHDGDFNIIAFAAPPNAQFADDLYFQITESRTFPKEFIEAFVQQSDFPETFRVEKPGYWYDETYNTLSTFINIHLTADYLVRISVETTNTLQYSGDLIKLKIFAEYVRLSYVPSIHENGRFTIHLDALLQNLAQNVHVDEEDLTEQMQPYAWSYDDDYICIKVDLGEGTHVEYRLRSVCERLRSLYANSCAFILGNNVVLVQNLSRIEKTESDYLTLLDNDMADNKLMGGASYSFGELFSLDKMYMQADIALRYGNGDRFLSLRTFESAILNYVIDNNERRLSPEYLCPKALFYLLDYDRHHKTNLVDTLQLYLENKCSINRCCETLYVHRSTLIYRIKRIEAIMGVDLESADMRLLLQIALRMLGKRSGALGPYAKACRIYRI